MVSAHFDFEQQRNFWIQIKVVSFDCLVNICVIWSVDTEVAKLGHFYLLS